MAIADIRFYSDVLKLGMPMTVILPEKSSGAGTGGCSLEGPHPVLYMLHGLSHDETTLARFTSIERYAAESGLVVVLPSTHSGHYVNQLAGYPYETYIAEELPQKIKSFFNISTKREDTFIGGLSMGARGAVKLAAKHPERFCAVIALSGTSRVTEIFSRRAFGEGANPSWALTYGTEEKIKNSENDIYYLCGRLGESAGPKPKFYVCCGLDDEKFILDGCREFYATFKDKLDITYAEGPGGHEFGYWDGAVREALEWLAKIRG